LIERQLERVTIKPQAIEMQLAGNTERPEGMGTGTSDNCEAGGLPQITITVPWSGVTFAEVKGILHSPSPHPTMSLDTRDAVLGAIAKARTWIDDIVDGRVGSFSEIAAREGKVERHIRLLAPLAFVSPGIISGIIEGVAPPTFTVTSLAKGLGYSWTE